MKIEQKGGVGRSCKNNSLRHYFSTLNCEKQQYTQTKCKTRQSKFDSAKHMLLWLLSICIGLVLAMTPIFNFKKTAPLDAGQVNDGEFTNAPWVQVNTASKPLFTGNNTVDGEVLYDLLSYINSTTVWNGVTENNTTPISGSAYTALTCEDFGKLDSDTSRNFAQLLVTLYGDTIIDANDKAVQWQVVYRSMDDTSDVLTLYMNSQYKTESQFDVYVSGTTCNNYLTSQTNIASSTNSNATKSGKSLLRDFVSTGTNSLESQVSTKYGTSYLVAPKDVPSSWQSTANQPDSDGSTSYSITNGLDNVSDLLWIPSGYEVFSVKNKTTNEWEKEDTELSWVWNVNDQAQETDLTKDDDLVVYNGEEDGEGNYTFVKCTTNGRTGLWRMNGYDRVINSWAWLRSGISDYLKHARGIN